MFVFWIFSTWGFVLFPRATIYYVKTPCYVNLLNVYFDVPLPLIYVGKWHWSMSNKCKGCLLFLQEITKFFDRTCIKLFQRPFLKLYLVTLLIEVEFTGEIIIWYSFPEFVFFSWHQKRKIEENFAERGTELLPQDAGRNDERGRMFLSRWAYNTQFRQALQESRRTKIWINYMKSLTSSETVLGATGRASSRSQRLWSDFVLDVNHVMNRANVNVMLSLSRLSWGYLGRETTHASSEAIRLGSRASKARRRWEKAHLAWELAVVSAAHWHNSPLQGQTSSLYFQYIKL